jgi:hypothetical protein
MRISASKASGDRPRRDGGRRRHGGGEGRGRRGHEVIAAITAESARRLGLEPGRKIVVVIKSTEVMLAVDD